MTKSWDAPEYLDDGVLHGFRSLFGDDVVEYPRMWHMYADSFGPGKEELSKIAARGFTYYGRMQDVTVDRTDIKQKLKTGYFDLIIMHAWYPSTLWPTIVSTTPREKIVILDGRDETLILEPYVNCGRYFKRELTVARSDVWAISFGFPKDKIQQPVPKTRSVAPLIPGDLSTYVYNIESEYYQQYNESCVAITMKKAGWDCLRHYEILGSQCIPWFIDLDKCPQYTCTTLPKDLLLNLNNCLQTNGTESLFNQNKNYYWDLWYKVQQHFQHHCTTEALAKYILGIVKPA
jgi:hypothetical protein